MGKRLNAAAKEIAAHISGRASPIQDGRDALPAEEGIALAKKTATTKFIGNIEVHVRLGIDPKKTDQTVRGTINLPHGTGKTKKIIVFVTEGKEKQALEAGAAIAGGEELIKKIKETNQTDFDVAIAEPAMMAKLGQIAKLLGPRGLMPSPKTGTVTAEFAKAIKEYLGGKMEFKNDESGNVHMILGKANFEDSQLLENFKVFIAALNQSKPAGLKKEYLQSVTLHATMGPAIKVKI